MSSPFPFSELPAGGRYSRQEAIAGWSQARLTGARILVVGAGALGNELLKNLALLGVGHLGIIDCDRVEETNLPRCALFRIGDVGKWKAEVAASRVRELNPELRATPYIANLLTEVGAGLLAEYDLLLGAVDSVAARWQLNRLSRRAAVDWIDGGVDSKCAQVAAYSPREGACYECGLTDGMWAAIHERHSCSAPGELRGTGAPLPVALPVVALAAALQAQETVSFLMRAGDPKHGSGLAAGERLSVSLAAYEMVRLRARVRESCLAHAEDQAPALSSGLTVDARVVDLLDQTVADALELEWEVVHSLSCPTCGPEHVALPAWRLRGSDLLCPECHSARAPEQLSVIAREDRLGTCTLASLGCPAKAHLRVRRRSGDRTGWYQLG